MTIDLDRLERESLDAWKKWQDREPCDKGQAEALYSILGNGNGSFEGAFYACQAAAFLTGARFDWGVCREEPYPDNADKNHGCAQALVAQWEGLAPVVVMPGEDDHD